MSTTPVRSFTAWNKNPNPEEIRKDSLEPSSHPDLSGWQLVSVLNKLWKRNIMVLILMGPMGCGKTTIGKMLAEKLGWSFYDGDDFHPQKNVEKMRAGIALTDEDRKAWLEKLHSNIQLWLKDKKNSVLACSALKQAYRELLGVNQNTVKTVYLKGSYELLRARIEERQHPYMDKNLLRSQLDALEEPKDGLTVDISATPKIVVRVIMDRLNLTP